jgi:hypothetical protein
LSIAPWHSACDIDNGRPFNPAPSVVTWAGFFSGPFLRRRRAVVYEKQRTAVDIAGNKVVLTERQNSEYRILPNGDVKYKLPPRLFGPDGKQLIPEGRGFYRTAFGVRYQLLEIEQADARPRVWHLSDSAN